jgi:hypothetical protein
VDAITWIKLRPDKGLSWHSVFREIWSRCGLFFPSDAPRADDLPAGERSCENCLRLLARDAERA